MRVPTVAIIVVNWNTRELLQQAIRSVRDHAGVPTHVIVVDNASADGSAGAVRAEFPDATLIVNQENRGFGQANNQGFAVGNEPFILLLNSDARITQGAMRAMVDELQRHPEAGAIGARLVYPDGRFQASWYPFPSLWSYGLELAGLSRAVFGPHYPSAPDASASGSHPADWVSGACMLLRREAVAAIGGFDADYHLYSEEMDLCRRLWQAGWSVRYCASAVAIHHVGQSTQRRALQQPRLLWESRLLYARKHHGGVYPYALYAMVRAAYVGRWIVWSVLARTTGSARREHWRHRARAASALVGALRIPPLRSASPSPSTPDRPASDR